MQALIIKYVFKIKKYKMKNYKELKSKILVSLRAVIFSMLTIAIVLSFTLGVPKYTFALTNEISKQELNIIKAGSGVQLGAAAQGSKYGGLVRCDGVVDPAVDGPTAKVCNFVELMNTANYIINWLFYIAVSLCVVMFSYAGFLYMSASESNVKQAKGIFSNVIRGFIWMLLGWFVVHELLVWLTESSAGYDALLK